MLVIVFPKRFEILEFIIVTFDPVTPFAVVDKLFALEVFEIEFMMLTADPAFPFTVVVSEFTELVFDTVPITKVVSVLPLTFVVI